MQFDLCILYAAGIYLTFAFDDLSFQAITSQSTTQVGPQHLYEASNAVDRNTATCTRTDQIGLTSPYKADWWKVDLGETLNIYSVNILFKNYENYENRQRGRLAGFSLHVSNTGTVQDSTLCYKDEPPKIPPLNFTTECIKSGRYVIYYNERLDGVNYPSGYELTNVFTELCEVIVKGCQRRAVYGRNCDIPCSIACKGNTCHILNGACLDCENGVYGSYCNLSCPTNCRNNTCHTRNGTCLDCKHGVYGSYCNISCPTNCKDNICHVKKGTCISCKTGWLGLQCETKCTEGLYGDNCNRKCSGHCRGNSPCNHVTGQCDGGCDAGWTGVMCNKECNDSTFGYACTNTCSGHCLNNSPCNKQSGHCDEGCNLGYTNGDCNKECNDSTFGYACTNTCSGHCLNNSPCNKQSGHCDEGCNPGYTNGDCNKGCEAGFYGLNCSNLCSGNCANSDPCDHVSGVCPGGCQNGYIGAHCNSSCKAGRYGKNCSIPCSQSCNDTCNHIDGLCEDCKESLKSHCPNGNVAATDTSFDTSSNNLPVTVGVIVCTCVVFTVGVVVFIFILRLKRKATMLKKRESIILEAKPSIKPRQIVDHKLHDSTYALPEKTKRGPPTNKNISVRNIMAQISNMSALRRRKFL